VKKRILILTAGFGEGHNSAARGIRDGLARVAPEQTEVELRDLFPEAYPTVNEIVRKTYLAVINRWPGSWGYVYRWLDRKKDFDERFQRFCQIKEHLACLLKRFRPHVVVSTFPAYPYLVRQIFGANPERFLGCKNVVVITDSITVNTIWYRCDADFFLAPNEQSASVLHAAAISTQKIKTFGFPVSPQFADFTQHSDLPASPTGNASRKERELPSNSSERRVLYMIHAATRGAPELARRLGDLGVNLTVTIGRAAKLRPVVEAAVAGQNTKIVGWTDDLPRMLHDSHLLIGKAGGATTQETIAAGCPMIINHVVAGQEEGNARLIMETNSGAIALSPLEVLAQVQRAFADGAKQWREWAANISRLSRPRASVDIAEFLLSI
jgi:UDP-N-acetylglucosamine:LPS N-acetylglucosamine transferase